MIFDAALAATDSQCHQDETARLHHRRLMLVLLLAACPIRLKNLQQIRVGRELQRRDSRWNLVFEGNEMKNGTRAQSVLPDRLSAPLADYLERIRPGFAPEDGVDALWLSTKGTALSYHSC